MKFALHENILLALMQDLEREHGRDAKPITLHLAEAVDRLLELRSRRRAA